MRAEREKAAVTVEPLLTSTPQSRWSRLPERPELQTTAAVERIGQLFGAALGKDPRYALALAELAVSAGEAILKNAYPQAVIAQVLAHAWKDLGKALRILARYEESIQAFRHAESLLLSNDHTGVLEYDLAIIRFNLAIACQETGRYEESLPLMTASKAVFRNHGDDRLVVMAGIAEGMLLQRLGRYREARETYLLILASSSNLERESVAALHNSIGFCSIELGDLREADANLTKAIVLLESLGQPLQALKATAGRGRLLIRRGEYERAITRLRTVRRQFLAYDLPEEAGLCGLEVVEAMLSLGHHGRAETLARKIVREFTVADLNTRAIDALAYLEEAITAKKASPSLVTRVREYILSLQTSPEREFNHDLDPTA